MICEHTRKWEMCFVGTVDIEVLGPGLPILTKYDDTNLNKCLEEGWEPFSSMEGGITLKRLKPCERCSNRVPLEIKQ